MIYPWCGTSEFSKNASFVPVVAVNDRMASHRNRQKASLNFHFSFFFKFVSWWIIWVCEGDVLKIISDENCQLFFSFLSSLIRFKWNLFAVEQRSLKSWRIFMLKSWERAWAFSWNKIFATLRMHEAKFVRFSNWAIVTDAKKFTCATYTKQHLIPDDKF